MSLYEKSYRNDMQKAGIGAFIYVIGMELIASIVALVLKSYFSNLIPYKNISSHFASLVNLTTYLILIFLLVFIFRDELQEDWKAYKGKLKYQIGLVACGYLMMILTNNLSSFIDTYFFKLTSASENQQSIVAMVTGGSFPALFVMVVFGSPIVEELVWRKSIFTLIKNEKIALLVTSIGFGLLHTYLSGDFLTMTSYVFSGFVFAYVYLKSGKNIWSSILLHSLSNLISIVAIAITSGI